MGISDEDLQNSLKRGGSFSKRYKVIRRLAESVFTIIYEMHDRRLKREVAIKILHPQFGKRTFIKQFFEGAQSQASLSDCDYIVKIYDIDKIKYSSNTYYFISMELMKTDLLRKLQKGKTISIRNSCQMGIEIAEGLIAVGDKNFIHMDLKPANIMLSNQGKIKISDFELSKIVNGQFTYDSRHLGTPHYAAPERFLEGEKISKKTDIYSFGCILYEILTGYTLFHGENPQIQMYAHLDKEPPRLSDMLANIPPEMDDLVKKMVNKKQENRPDAKQVKEILTLVLNNTPLDILALDQVREEGDNKTDKKTQTTGTASTERITNPLPTLKSQKRLIV